MHRWRRIVPLLLLLTACDRSGSDADGDEHRLEGSDDSGQIAEDLACEEATEEPACCQPAEEPLTACSDNELPSEIPVRGTFEAVDLSDTAAQRWRFIPALGQDKGEDAAAQLGEDVLPFEVTFSGTRLGDLLPDLSALGEVKVRDGGGCAWDGEGATGGVFEIREPETDTPLVMVGAGALTHDADTYDNEKDSWLSVSWGQSLGEVCPAREGNACAEMVVSHPVKVEYGGGSVILYQGQEATLNGLQVHILRAEQARGEGYCDDATGDSHNWFAVAVESTER